MEMQQMMKLLLARMDANTKANQEIRAGQKQMMGDRKADQENAEANREHMQQMMAKTETDREEMMARMDANQERTNASLREEIQSGQAKMRSILDVWIVDMKDGRKETMASQETTEARLECEERTSVDMESESEHWEVPKEDAIVKPEDGGSGIRTRIWLRSAARNRREGPGDIVDPEESDRCQHEDDLLCKSGMVQERHHQKGLHQGQG
jgi:hypothetical protein